MFSFFKKTAMPTPDQALAGRTTEIETATHHYVSQHPLKGPYPDGMEKAIFGLGCFWGAERLFWQLPGVYVTAVGYSGGYTPNPTYREVCTGSTGHNEVVLVVYDANKITYAELVKTFFESHDPTQGARQGNDVGTQYRSGIYVFDEKQKKIAEEAAKAYAPVLAKQGYDAITTEIIPAGPFYFAESEHQQYLAKNPHGYCGLGGTGATCPLPVMPA